MPQSWDNSGGECEVYACKGSLFAGTPASESSGQNSPASALMLLNTDLCNLSPNLKQATHSPTGLKAPRTKSDKSYLGVRVRMPVRDLLRNIRLAKGVDPKELQKKENKGTQGDKKRVRTSGDRRNKLKKLQMKSLEELSIIVEVLEEDLKTSSSSSRSDGSPGQGEENSCGDTHLQGPVDGLCSTPSGCAVTEEPPIGSAETYSPYPVSVSAQVTTPFSDTQGGCCSRDLAYCSHSSESGIFLSPIKSDYQVSSPQETSYFKSKMVYLWGSSERMSSPSYRCSVQEEWDSMAFFCSQLEQDEKVLKSISDQELLPLDECGRTLLHRAVEEGELALVYAVAKRMANLNKLDSKDKDGKTALHLAAQRNQHLMVSDLLSLGANINERDRNGKTCLHLSAEHGYTRVLEVIKRHMISGTYIDLEARDINGLTALQQASLALKYTVRELERSVTVRQTQLLSLHKDQMMETLKCLLHMECNVQPWAQHSTVKQDFRDEIFHWSFENEVI